MLFLSIVKLCYQVKNGRIKKITFYSQNVAWNMVFGEEHSQFKLHERLQSQQFETFKFLNINLKQFFILDSFV